MAPNLQQDGDATAETGKYEHFPVTSQPEGQQLAQWEEHTAANAPAAVVVTVPPDSRCPSEWVAAESTLIRMLVRHYGWQAIAAGQLIRRRA